MTVVEVAEVTNWGDIPPKSIVELMTEWNLSIRTFNVLKREGVTTLDRLTFLTEDQLWDMRNLRADGVNEIIAKLHEHGHKLNGYTLFREIIGIPGLKPGYTASRDGKIQSPKGHELKSAVRKNGRQFIYTVVDGRNTVIPLDVLVLSAYYGYKENHKPIYKDGNALNCHIDNLEWRSLGKHKKSDFIPGELTTRWRTPAGGKVETYRMYVSDDVTASVSDDGSGSIKVGTTTVSLTARQLNSLTKVAARIAEMNSLMGIG
jgi:hypothetical protein